MGASHTGNKGISGVYKTVNVDMDRLAAALKEVRDECSTIEGFTSKDVMESEGVGERSAQRRIAKLVKSGMAELIGKAKNIGADGIARGNLNVYRLTDAEG